MSDTEDPTDDARAKMNAAAAQFGASLTNVINLSFRQSIAKQIEKEFGPGPWILHADGRVEKIKPKPVRRVK